MVDYFKNIALLDPDLPKAILGESPLWNPKENAFYWVDIKGRLIHRYELLHRQRQSMVLPCEIGFIALTAAQDFIAGLTDGLYRVNFVAKTWIKLTDVPAAKPFGRFNDGGCDRQGRLYAGTMKAEDDPASTGALYRYDGTVISLVAGDIPISNGVAWDQAGTILYYADTERHVIWQYDYDPMTGIAANRRVFKQFTDDILPDGLTVDSRDHVFVAFYSSGKIQSFTPQTELASEIILPVKDVTSCVFGGLEMKTLFITTAAENEMQEAPEKRIYCGQVLTVELDVPGVVETPFQSAG